MDSVSGNDSGRHVSAPYNEFVFDYSRHTGEGWKKSFIKEYFPVVPYNLKNIVNSLQYSRGLIGGGTEGMKDFLEYPSEICEIGFGPRLIPNYDTDKLTKEGLPDENLEIICSRSPSLQILGMVMPRDNQTLVENVIEDSEYASFGKIPFDSAEHKKRTERLKETGKKSADIFSRYSEEILNMSPRMITRYTSNPAFKGLITKTIEEYGGDPSDGRARALVHYTTKLNFCQESCKKKVLGENIGHIPQLKSWNKVPEWVKDNLIQNAIGILPPVSIDGSKEMDRGIPLFIGNGEIVESQIGEINRLWKEYENGNKTLSISLKNSFGKFALPEEEGITIKIPGGNLGEFTASVAAYMLPEKYNYLFEELQKIPLKDKKEVAQEKIRELRKQKKELLHEMWGYASENILNLARSARV